MALKDTFKHLNNFLSELTKDLVKAEKGNKAASQRIRTKTIKFAKLAKVYRKESIEAEKKGLFKKAKVEKKKPAKKVAKKVAKKPVAKKKKGKK